MCATDRHHPLSTIHHSRVRRELSAHYQNRVHIRWSPDNLALAPIRGQFLSDRLDHLTPILDHLTPLLIT